MSNTARNKPCPCGYSFIAWGEIECKLCTEVREHTLKHKYDHIHPVESDPWADDEYTDYRECTNCHKVKPFDVMSRSAACEPCREGRIAENKRRKDEGLPLLPKLGRPTQQRERKTCAKGHDLTQPEAYKLTKQGYRRCVKCQQAADLKHKEKKRKQKELCVHGHDQAEHGFTTDAWPYQRCRLCQRTNSKARYDKAKEDQVNDHA